MQIKTLLKAARMPFLVLTPVCILFAYSIAKQTETSPNLADTLMILLGALAAHIAVNLLNEYQDFRSGLDLLTNKTPFSGGSGALPENPEGIRIVLLSALICLALVAWIGIHFISTQGTLVLLPIGVLGILLIIGYTQYINRLPWFCLFSPGFGFGTLMVLGTVLLLSGNINAQALMLSLIPFFQVNNLLLLNQFPDIEADRQIGRKHFPINYGTELSAKVYGAFALIPFILISAMLLMGSLPSLGAIALLPLLPALLTVKAVNRHQGKIGEHPKFLALNVMVTLLTPTLLAVSLLLG